MEYELKRINVWPVIKIVFLISFFLGAIIGIFYTLIIAIVGNLIQQLTGEGLDFFFEMPGGITLFFIILFFATFTSLINSILSSIFIGIYNLMAHWIGGFRVDLDTES